MDKRFGQPNGNPIGKTSEQKALEIANAEAATRLHGKMLAALERQLESATDAATIESITANILKLTKDAQDRGLGAPVQLVDNTSSDGSMTPKPAIDAKKLSDGAMAEILNASPDEG
jgi:hypothetical protein